MSISELFAAVLRIILWAQGKLDSLQQVMAIKNVLFLSNIMSAYSMRASASLRNWNSRDLGFGLKMPSRIFQIEISRWAFAFIYCVQGAMLSFILIQVTNDRFKWMANIGLDIFFAIVFLVYCKNVHVQKVRGNHLFGQYLYICVFFKA